MLQLELLQCSRSYFNMINDFPKVSWTVLKSFIDTKGASLQWVTRDTFYEIYAVDGQYTVQCTVDITDPANPDQIDFETNYKTQGNQALRNLAYQGDRVKVDTNPSDSADIVRPLIGPSAQTTLTVNSSTVQEVKVGVTALASRKLATLQPVSGKIYIYFGADGAGAPSPATVIADGAIIFKNAKETFEAGPLQPIYILAVSGLVDVKVIERA